MPWKLITIIFFIILLLFFVGFNLDNKTDISLLVFSFEQVHTVIALLISFMSGVVIAIPATILAGRKKNKEKKQKLSKKKSKKKERQETISDESSAIQESITKD